MRMKGAERMAFSTSTNIHQAQDGRAHAYAVTQSIDALHAAGFTHADVTLAAWCAPDGPMAQPNWQAWVGEIGEALSRHGMAANQTHTLFYLHKADAETLAFQERMVERCLRASAMLGAPWTVMHILRVADLGTRDADEAMDRNEAYFRPYGEMARRYGVGIAIENGLTGLYHHAADLLELVRRLNDDAFGICWDTGHANIVCPDQGPEIRSLGRHLKALHLNDNHGVKDEHLLPFFGTVDFAAVMAAVRDTGFSGVLTLESAGSVRPLPACMRPEALRLAAATGEALRSIG